MVCEFLGEKPGERYITGYTICKCYFVTKMYILFSTSLSRPQGEAGEETQKFKIETLELLPLLLKDRPRPRVGRENKIKMSGSATAAPNNMSNLDTPEDLDQFVQELMDNMVRRTENGNNNYYFVVGACSDLDCHSSTYNSRYPTSITTCTLYEQQTRFNRLSDSIIERVDTMGNKIDQLEKSINELIDEAGIDVGARKDSSTANHKIMERQDESDTAEF